MFFKLILLLQRNYPFTQFDDEETEIQQTTGRKRLFSKELRCMMYGFGDDQNPYTESVDLLEDLVIEFITETTHRAMEIGRTGRVQVEDIVFLVWMDCWFCDFVKMYFYVSKVRKDQRKYARVKDLLTMNEELKRARKAFDEIKYVGKLFKNRNVWRLTIWIRTNFVNFFFCRKRGKTKIIFFFNLISTPSIFPFYCTENIQNDFYLQ